MNQALQKYLEAATGITSLTKTQAERIVKQMVKQGEAARDQAGDLVDELVTRSRENREQLSKVVKAETQRVISSLGLASQSEVERLNKQVSQLKRRVAEAEKATEAAGSSSSGAKKTSSKKAAAKKSGKKSTKKAAKKTAAKKTTKKSAAKKTTKKSS